jgi:hypothetical protein
MYAPSIVVPAVESALKSRGFVFPAPGSGIGKDAVAARRLAYDALHNYTNATPSGIAKLIGCTAATALTMQQAAHGFYRTPADRQAWLNEVKAEIDRGIERLQSLDCSGQ